MNEDNLDKLAQMVRNERLKGDVAPDGRPLVKLGNITGSTVKEVTQFWERGRTSLSRKISKASSDPGPDTKTGEDIAPPPAPC